MNFQKRYVFGIVVVFLTSLTATELFRGNINEPLLFDQSGLIRILSDLGVVITVTFLLIQLYIHLLWRFDPLCKIPVLKKEYTGTVAYVYKGNISSNKINIKVKQAMDKVRLDMTTPLMRSRTLNGCFVEDRGMPVLYYVFYTEPRVVDPDPSEKRTGAARLLPNENGDLEGYYWTDQGNRGRLYFYITGSLPMNAKSQCKPTQGNSGGGTTICSLTDKETYSTSNTNIVTVSVGSGSFTSNANSSTSDLLSCLIDISNKRDASFSGLGLIVCDSSFDQINLVSMRPGELVDGMTNVYSDKGKECLLSIASTKNNSHDGFLVVDKKGFLLKKAQYLFPPLSSRKPDICRGTRSYSALCGSTLKGVIAIGIISEDGSVAIYKDGQCIYDSRKSSHEGAE